MKFKNPYKTEAELCDAFVEQAKHVGWQVYPECCNWDIVLVNGDGIQVGIEAKLRCNLDVVAQAIPHQHHRRHNTMLPHYVGVLVPLASPALRSVCQALEVHVWDHDYISGNKYMRKHGVPENYTAGNLHLKPGYCIDHPTRLKLPEVAVQSSAGRPSPKVMSDWRVKALRACILLEEQGYLLRSDLTRLGLSPTRWTQYWMEPCGHTRNAEGRKVTKYVPKRNGDLMPSKGYEDEMAVLKEMDVGDKNGGGKT